MGCHYAQGYHFARPLPVAEFEAAAQRYFGKHAREMTLQEAAMLAGLAKAGYKETIKKIARKIGYKPDSQVFFEALGWKQKQAEGGHREVGLFDLKITKKQSFESLSEAEICEAIVDQKLGFKDAVGRLPKGMGLTPAIMVTLLPSLSDRDLRILTPTIEELGVASDVANEVSAILQSCESLRFTPR